MLEIVWGTVQKRIPEIKQDLRKIKNIVGRIIKFKKELTEIIDNDRKKVFVLISNILKEKGMKYKLINSIKDINFNEGQREIILLHFDAIDKSRLINGKVKIINLQK